jgi:glycosyltransferase involved in cell wall biosynthesis
MTEKPIRLLVIGNLPPHVLGGAENQVARLVEAWINAGVYVEVAGHRIPDGEQQLGAVRLSTSRIRTPSTGGRTSRGLSYFLSITRLILRRRHDFDAIYCRGMGDGLLSLALLRAIRLCALPIIAVPINSRGAGDVTFLQSIPGWKTWIRLLNREISAIILINKQITAELDAVGIIKPLRHHIPNGIPVLPAIQRREPNKIRRLLWTGRLERQKGIDLLLPALAKCHQRGALFNLQLLGDGPLKEQLQEQANKLGLSDVVEFIPSVPTESIRMKLCSADVFVLPSRYEGMSNAGLEAMEASLPILCTQCGGIDSVIADIAGWVCPPENPDALFEILSEMLNAPGSELLARGQNARKIVEENFPIKSVAAANLRVISPLIKQKEK